MSHLEKESAIHADEVEDASAVARLREQQMSQRDAEINKFINLLTPQKLAEQVKHYVIDESGTKEEICDVPNDGNVCIFPSSYCSDCVDRIASYFQNENMAKNILGNTEADKEVYISDRKLAICFLDAQRLHFYDHVTVEAFNKHAMYRGGPNYDTPLSMACLADTDENLYEKLAGKETVCASFSTGVAMLCKMGSTHKQVLEENVDSNMIRNGCYCFKSTEWLINRADDKRKLEKLLRNDENALSWGHYKKTENWQLEDRENVNPREDEKIKTSNEQVEFDRPGNFDVHSIKDSEYLSNMKTTSSCLALCRHAPSCFVNTINKKRILESLMLVSLPENEQGGISSTTPGQNFIVIAKQESSLIFSLGATVYEALASQSNNGCWRDNDEVPTVAKVYTTVNTVAAPVFRSAPVSRIEHQNKYGYYKTFRICFPGNFSGRYNDSSITWRSEFYVQLTCSAAKAECHGNNKSHRSFMDQNDPWPRIKSINAQGGIVYDNSGDMSGNYLCDTIGYACMARREAVIAYDNTRNMTAILKNIKESIGQLLMGPFKNSLVELKYLDMEQAAANKSRSLTETEMQHLHDIRDEKNKKLKFIALTIEKYEHCLKYLELHLSTMNKYLSYNLDGYLRVSRHGDGDYY